MRKLIFSLVLIFTSVLSVSAQDAIQTPKFFDNTYIGLTGGAAFKTTNEPVLENLSPVAGVVLGKDFNPIFGARVDGQVYFDNMWKFIHTSTTLTGFDLNLLGTINFSNWFWGYKGQPRHIEVTGVFGAGWFHLFDNDTPVNDLIENNYLSSKFGLDLAWNPTRNRDIQFYLEPAIHYYFNGPERGFNVNKSWITVSAGIVYKFKTSNGTHNFKTIRAYDQEEVNALMSRISSLEKELAKKPTIIEKETKIITTVSDKYVIEFAQNSYELTDVAKSELNKILDSQRVAISAGASPEGDADYNKTLSQNRANAVKNYLESRGVTVVEAIGNGVLNGASNRIAVVTIQ